ncbi:unnamed protein product [Leptidea sinapis]|uniref:Uncharacterized protein n=1 Tax=Leptidea sinapis TaxID=189913 RepID=A0A5E4R813_9NEOP|nr:unnamed protein product [Leptidea sinapis]
MALGARNARLTYKHCVNIPAEGTVAAGWLCPDCKARTPRKDNTEIPVRSVKSDFISTSQESSSSCGTCTDMLKKLKNINDNMMSIKDDCGCMKEDLSVLRGAVEHFSGRLDNMESRLACLEDKFNNLQTSRNLQSSSEVSGLLSIIEDLKAQVNDREQEAVCNDFEISGIPEQPRESAAHLVCRFAEKLGVTFEERDLVLAERAGVRRAPSCGAGAAVAAPACSAAVAPFGSRCFSAGGTGTVQRHYRGPRAHHESH